MPKSAKLAHCIRLLVMSDVGNRGKTEMPDNYKRRCERATTTVDIFTREIEEDKTPRMQKPGERIAEFIRALDNPVYTIKDIRPVFA